jgi:vacuolar-type H+-ATPase subunit I/STV1
MQAFRHSILVFASCFALLSGAASIARDLIPPQTNRPPSSAPARHRVDCAERLDALDRSKSEGEERLTEKYDAIEFCSAQYKRDAIVQKLVDECAKYEEQAVIKQQFLTECMLAAFKYANALSDLKAEYKK